MPIYGIGTGPEVTFQPGVQSTLGSGFEHPYGVAVDSAGNLYVADSLNDTIRKIAPVGTNWVVSTIGGLAGAGGASDGTGTNAQFYEPAGVAVDSAGNVYVAGWVNDTIRMGVSVTPAIMVQPQSSTNVVGSTVVLSVTAGGEGPLSYQWQFDGVDLTSNESQFSGVNTAVLTISGVQGTNAGVYSVVVSSSEGSVNSAVATVTVL